MAEEPQVIQDQMEETRSALADKLGQLTEKITGTVENVQETVQNITGTVENVEHAVEKTVESVAETVESVGETASGAVESVKEAFNIPKQFDRHPWLFFGGSVVVGFLGGRMLFGSSQQSSQNGRSFSQSADRMADRMSQSTSATAQPADYTARASQSREDRTESSNGHTAGAESEQGSWLSGLVQKFLPDLNKIKELALGTLFATTRDLVTQNMPQSLKSDVSNLFNDITTHAGGKPIQGQIFEEGTDQNTEQNRGTDYGQSNSPQQNTGKKNSKKEAVR